MLQGIRSRLRWVKHKSWLRYPTGVSAPRRFYFSTEDWYDAMCKSGASSPTCADAQYICIEPAHSIRFNLARMRDDVSRKTYDYITPSTFAAVIPNGRLFEHSVITPDNRLLADASRQPGANAEEAEKNTIFQYQALPAPVALRGEVVALSASCGMSNYYHWLYDVLPRLEVLRQSGIKLSEDAQFAVNSNRLGFQREMLEILGIKRVIATEPLYHLRAEILIVPSLPGVTGGVPKWVCDYLRRTFLDRLRLDVDGVAPEKMIYISRAGATYRRITNEAEVEELLMGHGFEVFKLEEISVAEQITLFHQARIVVAPHGAGLSNLVFCQPGTKVLEMCAPQYVNPCFWTISDGVNLDHFYMLGRGERAAEQFAWLGCENDMEIDLHELDEFVSTLAS